MHNESTLFAIVIHSTESKEGFQIFVIDFRQTYTVGSNLAVLFSVLQCACTTGTIYTVAMWH